MPIVGVLSLQGGFQRHVQMLQRAGAVAVPVRSPEDLSQVDGLVIPGGESTTIGMLSERAQLIAPLRERIGQGMPVMGTCAGAILLARDIENSTQTRLGILPISVARNAYGRQIASFEAELPLPGEEQLFTGVFIRAPQITACAPDVHVLVEFEGKPVMVQQNAIIALTFHPELTGDQRIHTYFLRLFQ